MSVDDKMYANLLECFLSFIIGVIELGNSKSHVLSRRNETINLYALVRAQSAATSSPEGKPGLQRECRYTLILILH